MIARNPAPTRRGVKFEALPGLPGAGHRPGGRAPDAAGEHPIYPPASGVCIWTLARDLLRVLGPNPFHADRADCAALAGATGRNGVRGSQTGGRPSRADDISGGRAPPGRIRADGLDVHEFDETARAVLFGLKSDCRAAVNNSADDFTANTALVCEKRHAQMV
jgi:hypothetical protein